ncbi:MAG: hypothetical protein GY925_10295 [Actinomycetia bacterium]|nr:hypothetical protein [Actinomycetes bacterium]
MGHNPRSMWFLVLLNGLLLYNAYKNLTAVSGLVMIAALIGTYLFHIAVHELGHAVAAFAVGYQTTAIVVGAGPRLISGRLGGVDVALHLFPLGGYTSHRGHAALASKPGFWAREFLVTAAGPLATLSLTLVSVFWLNDFGAIDLKYDVGIRRTHHIGSELAFVGWWLLVINLVPMLPNSDGSKLFAMLFRRRQAAAHRDALVANDILQTQRIDATAELPAETFGPLSGLMKGMVLHGKGRDLEALALLDSVNPEDLDPTSRSALWSSMATICLRRGDLTRADALSLRALHETDPPTPTAQVAHAEVLFATGERAEANRLFDAALAIPGLGEETRESFARRRTIAARM